MCPLPQICHTAAAPLTYLYTHSSSFSLSCITSRVDTWYGQLFTLPIRFHFLLFGPDICSLQFPRCCRPRCSLDTDNWNGTIGTPSIRPGLGWLAWLLASNYPHIPHRSQPRDTAAMWSSGTNTWARHVSHVGRWKHFYKWVFDQIASTWK